MTVKKELTAIYTQLNDKLGFVGSGETLYKLFTDLIEEKLSAKVGHRVNTPITFSDLHVAGFKDLYVVGVNTRTGEAEYFSYEHTPDMLVANAVRISMSIPGVFYPVAKMTKAKDGQIHVGKEL